MPLYTPDDTMRPWKPSKAKKGDKEKYEPNLKTTAREFARQGYATLAAADPDSWRYPDRPLIGEPDDEYGFAPFRRW